MTWRTVAARLAREQISRAWRRVRDIRDFDSLDTRVIDALAMIEAAEKLIDAIAREGE